ncbi:MAG: diaminopropionate ammonia-lyase [Proteobacteria bacterium]|nr:MAG: diaminopropionate ammonia-lyase [Pseudomonadota bacterium]
MTLKESPRSNTPTVSCYAQSPIHHFANPRAERCPWPPRLDHVLDEALIAQAGHEIRKWPAYSATPIRELDALARTLGIARILYKDESERFGLGSFKALGGAYAVLRLLMNETGLCADEIRGGGHRERLSRITVVTATDGNHGRSVAWGAQTFGCACRIYIHQGVSTYREDAMRILGADVVRVDGNYDESVRRAAEDSLANGWFVVSDTSWHGYTEIPRYVMAGYALMIDEVLDALGDACPTHVVVQGGVGGLAASVAARLWMRYGEARPTIVVVEPDRADCLYQTAMNAAPVAIDIVEETLMAGLSCGEVSLLAWAVLETGADHFLTITDDHVAQAMKDLGAACFSDARIVAGESAVAGLCGLIQCAIDETLARVIGLDAESAVLLLGTEGATDPAIYRSLTGLSATP